MTSHVVRVPVSRGMRQVLTRVGLVLAAVTLVSGCMVGPKYERPSAAVNSTWEAIDGVQESPTVPDWWRSFNDPVLTSLIEEAHGQNLSLRVAGLRVIEARAARGVAVGEFFPQVQNAFGSVGADQLSRNEAGASGDRVFSSDRIGLEAAWELDFWGKFRRGIEAADAGVLLAVANFDAVFVTLTAEVASNYVLIRSLQERLGFARANVELQKETLELTETRFRAGAVSELDVATARATLANTRALIPELELALRQTTLALGVLLGKTPSDLAASLAPPRGEALRVPDAPAQIAAGVPADLLRRRPDVRAAERLAAAQSARIGQAEADLYPSISIAGSTGFASSTFENGRGSDLGDIFDADSFTGFIGLSVNWPIFNYGRIRSNVRVQDARYEQAVAAYREVVLRAAADVEAGLAEFLRSRERTVHLSEAVVASSRSVELSLIQYRAGAVDFIRVNDAQTQLVAQQDNLVVSRASIALGAVRTYRALGGGWEVRGESEYVDSDTATRMRERTNWGEVLDPSWHEGKDLGFPRPDAPGAKPAAGSAVSGGGL
ncbi:MAG: efflux transporter outer membrane subunit [Phycisphaeraceae bacterium]|nr:efflux transporter outer membrane subunit [Phycisphaeraceae bacterium]